MVVIGTNPFVSVMSRVSGARGSYRKRTGVEERGRQAVGGRPSIVSLLDLIFPLTALTMASD